MRFTLHRSPGFAEQGMGVLARGGAVTTLDEAVALAASDRGLAIVATLRADATIQSSLVNVGLIAHPVDDSDHVLGFVTYGRIKLANLRARPQLAVTFRNGWQWATVEGNAEIAGPDDPQPWLEPDKLPQLLRTIFRAAGGSHDDWDEYDRVMAEQRRAAVLVRPTRVYSNGA
jgi:PPOX class probable F420-dependent enzyme